MTNAFVLEFENNQKSFGSAFSFHIGIFQKLFEGNTKSKFIHWFLGSWLLLLPRPSLIGSSNSNTGFHKVMRRSFQKWLWPDKFNNAWRTIASIKSICRFLAQSSWIRVVTAQTSCILNCPPPEGTGKARMCVGNLAKHEWASGSAGKARVGVDFARTI